MTSPDQLPEQKIRRRCGARLLLSWTAACFLASGLAVTYAGSRVVIPKPTDPLAATPPAPSVDPSVLNIPVIVSAQDVIPVVIDAFPDVVTNEGDWRDGPPIQGQPPYQWQYRLHRGPVQVSFGDRLLETKFPDVRYRVGVRDKRPGSQIEDAICGYGQDPPRRLSLTARSQLRWTDEWTVRASTSFLQPAFQDPCRQAGSGPDVTTIVKTEVESRLPVLARRLDDRIREHSERRRAMEKTWRQLQEPAELAPDLWLRLRPGAVQAGPFMGNGDQQIRTSVTVELEPVIVSGPKPPAENGPVPPLQLAPAASDGFHLAVPITADYVWINGRLKDQLVGQTIPMSLGEPVRITSAELYGSGRNLIIALGVTGGVDGMLYASGKPVLDASTNILRFDQFDFTMETRNVLVRAAQRMMRGVILDAIEPQTRIDLSEQIDTLRSRLGKALSREIQPGARLEGSITRLEPRGIYPVTGGVEIQVIAHGTLELRVQ